MGIKAMVTNSLLANYGKSIRTAPREVIFNRSLLLSPMLYAFSAIPATWDQGSASVIPSLQGFQKHFGIRSGADANEIRNFVSIVYVGYAAGAALSFFVNDRIGRLWSFRPYTCIWTVGQVVGAFAPGLPGLYASRIISGLGIGALTATGPMSIVEIAPTEIRGLLTAWFVVAMGLSLVSSVFCVDGVFLHIPPSRLQYQTVFFSPCIFMFLCNIGSFLACESLRWLMLVDRQGEATRSLARLRGMPADHPRVQGEIRDIEISINKSRMESGDSFLGVMRETFLVPSNLRRVQQTLVSYALAQLSGANSVTSYFVPILTLMGVGGGTTRNLFLTGMYGMSKFFFCLIASFFFIDALGRRKSLFVGITLQMMSDIFIGVYIKYKQEGTVPKASSEAAIAAIFIHAFGYAVGLLTLPYVFGGELWPNRIRSFGAQTDNWGAFLFFAGWCFISFLYVYLMVPEVAGLSVEQIDSIFEGHWFKARQRVKQVQPIYAVGNAEDGCDKNW
ncbi:MFS general substrate transporter [Cadophora sp. DSE1049]|nr:MFS general substrate transporter [Cadophora sp. DSE1049]